MLEKKAVEHIVFSLGVAPPQPPGSQPNSPQSEQILEQPLSSLGQTSSSLLSLRVDDCSLRPAALEVLGAPSCLFVACYLYITSLAHAVRTSALRNISLRHNRITVTGAVALALMIKDYPDSVPSALVATPSSPLSPSSPSAPAVPFLTTPSPAAKPKSGPIPPPPRHPVAIAQSIPPQTTYTPYIPKARRNAAAAAAARTSPGSFQLSQPPAGRTSTNALPFGESVPLITSSAQGGVTTRHPPARPTPANHAVAAVGHGGGKHSTYDQGPSVALLDKVRALDHLPRLGALRTLDLRGNDIRVGLNMSV